MYFIKKIITPALLAMTFSLVSENPLGLPEYAREYVLTFRSNGTLYHFYCGVRPAKSGDIAVCKGNEFRSILLAADKKIF